MVKKIILITFLMVCLVSIAVARTPSADNASVYIISPSHGEMVTNPVTVRFGLQGMGVAPAGIDKAKTGHHHLMVDAKLKSMDDSIPKDKKHMHFGGGQTETTLKLSPGRHTLQLMMGDMKHVPHNPPVMSQQITIFVQ